MTESCNSEISLRTLTVAVTATATKTKRILSAQYGDGYKSRRPDGLNPWKTVWQVDTVPLQPEAAYTLEAELEATGELPFYWLPPGGAEESVWCLEPVQWKRSYNAGLIVLTFTIENWNGVPPSSPTPPYPG
jgi:phage-related protein